MTAIGDRDLVPGPVVDLTEGKASMELFRLAIEAAPTGMIMVDGDGRITLVNAQVERLFGYPREVLIGQPIEMLVPARFRAHHPGHRSGFLREPRFRAMGAGRDLFGLHRDGTEVPIEIGLNPLHTPTGDFVLSSVVDITDRKRAEHEREELLGQLRVLNAELEERVGVRTAQLTTTLKEREVLLQEVHHRVKNNLQVISSLINLQVRKLDDSASRDALTECQTRVQAIALIHEQLYQSRDYARVPFSDYARSLAANVFLATGVAPATVALELAIDDLALAVDKAIPCGLVLNELITNALKHGFPDGRRGTLHVQLVRLDGATLRLIVKDDGVGWAPDFDVRASDAMGMQLVCTLAAQLDAELLTSGVGGATFQLTFAAST